MKLHLSFFIQPFLFFISGDIHEDTNIRAGVWGIGAQHANGSFVDMTYFRHSLSEMNSNNELIKYSKK